MDVKILIPEQLISVDGVRYINSAIASERAQELEQIIENLTKLLNVYRQTVFEVRDRLDKMDGDQQSWLDE